MNLDAYFGIHAKSLQVRDQRAAQIAFNITNANTPNYKAMDLNFQDALASNMSPDKTLSMSSPGHISGGSDFSLHLQERKTQHTSQDGNTVDKDAETIEFSRNALNYQASLTFLGGKIKSMLLAIRGE